MYLSSGGSDTVADAFDGGRYLLVTSIRRDWVKVIRKGPSTVLKDERYACSTVALCSVASSAHLVNMRG